MVMQRYEEELRMINMLISQQQINELKDVIIILQQIDSELFFSEICSINEKIDNGIVARREKINNIQRNAKK